MMDEKKINGLLDSYQRCKETRPEDPYWSGAVAAIEEILGITRIGIRKV